MKKDNMMESITAIEKWCGDNQISIFYGSIEERTLTKVKWDNNSCKDWEKYLIVLKNSDSKTLIIDTMVNDVDSCEEEITAYKEKADDQERDDFDKAFVTIQKNTEFIAYFELNFIHNNVCYEYSECADWFEDYMTVMKVFDESENITADNRLSNEKIEEWARKVLSDQRYFTSQSYSHKLEIIRANLDKEEVNSVNYYGIRNKADSIYELEIKPKLDEELKIKISELKTKKLSKVKIASMLGISMDRVNKFYYCDES